MRIEEVTAKILDNNPSMDRYQLAIAVSKRTDELLNGATSKLSVAKNVKVEKFRYITEIEAGEKKLLHVSSHISGDVGDDWHARIGDILKALLPAGSISGAPKKSTLDIIEQVEGYERGYFSGVFGVYDGKTFKSAVMIRFVEKTQEGYTYKSGGGITLDSDAKSEYAELLDKVYLP